MAQEDRGDFPCLNCEHCWLDGGTPGYSEWTPATPMEWKCWKGHFNLSGSGISKDDIESVLEMGKTCTDYEKEVNDVAE